VTRAARTVAGFKPASLKVAVSQRTLAATYVLVADAAEAGRASDSVARIRAVAAMQTRCARGGEAFTPGSGMRVVWFVVASSNDLRG
jgi:hypothetical protein